MAYSILLRGNDYEFTLEMDGTYDFDSNTVVNVFRVYGGKK